MLRQFLITLLYWAIVYRVKVNKVKLYKITWKMGFYFNKIIHEKLYK